MVNVEIKINTSDRSDEILQKLADNLGIKKAELVKDLVIKELIKIREKNKYK